ncbi:MAG TPA: hypothetical protein VHW60_04405 [Caulobacteraceae bacterium]|nr:hypothetical protein [Caulobacteraceae bacterium]
MPESSLDSSFEFRLERMYAEAPALADADLFTLRVLDRVDRGWTARRLLIGVMGAAGGLIGGFQLVSSGAVGTLAAISARSNAYLTQHMSDQVSGVFAPASAVMNGEVLLTAVALALIAAGFGVARLIREI